MNTHKDVYIVLKDNLKWIPVLGLVSTTCEPIKIDGGLIASTGHAILQLHFPQAFMGVRSCAPVIQLVVVRSPSREGRFTIDIHLIPRRDLGK